jgi:asparagine synthase (glutamine-hydrolysing)
MEFVVFPDRAETTAVAAELTQGADRTEYYDSGQPWIVGRWTASEFISVCTGSRRLALLGRSMSKPETLVNVLRRVRTASDLDKVTRGVPGSYFLISMCDGLLRVQGTLSDAHRIFYAEVGGITVAADRPDRLVSATDASIDERVVALQLLTPYSRPPWPIGERCVWKGVHKLPPAHFLEIGRQAAVRIGRWWQPPDPVVPLAHGAEQIRASIHEAVSSRVDRSGSSGLSIDLSGGMDSTSLCFVADHLGIPITSLHTSSADPSNVDTSWAARARDDLTSARHVVIPSQTLPGAFDEAAPLFAEISLEGPAGLVHRMLIDSLASTMAEAGSATHLRGDGGDELFHPNITHTVALIRRHLLTSLTVVPRLKAANRWSTMTTLRNLRRVPSYQRWLKGVSDRLTAPHDHRQTPGWEIPCQLPQWATPAAVTLVRGLFDEALAEDAQPLIDDPVQNEILRQVQLLGAAARQCSQIGERYGVTFESPYLDLHVVENALSIRFEDRALPGVNKRVLAAAMQGVVPPDILARRDKSHATRSMFDSLRRGRHRLVELCADPTLARRGLIDAESFRSVVLGIHPDLKPLVQLGPTRATELWLRALPERLAGPATYPGR